MESSHLPSALDPAVGCCRCGRCRSAWLLPPRLHLPGCTVPSPQPPSPGALPALGPGTLCLAAGQREAGRGPSPPLLCHLPPSPCFWFSGCHSGDAWQIGQKPMLRVGAQASLWGVTPKELSDCQAQLPACLPLSTCVTRESVSQSPSRCVSFSAHTCVPGWGEGVQVPLGSSFTFSVSTSASLRLFPGVCVTLFPHSVAFLGCLIRSLFLPLPLHSHEAERQSAGCGSAGPLKVGLALRPVPAHARGAGAAGWEGLHSASPAREVWRPGAAEDWWPTKLCTYHLRPAWDGAGGERVDPPEPSCLQGKAHHGVEC